MFEGFLEWMTAAGVWTGIVIWTVLVGIAYLSILVALPGGWAALALAVAYDAFTGFSAIGFWKLGLFAALLGVAEAVEALLGSVYVAKQGATKWGVIGAFAGGIVGSIAGTPLFPIVGTIAGGFAGAFGGAVTGEYLRDRQLEPSIRVGFHATVGRLLAVFTKAFLAGVGVVVVVVSAWRFLLLSTVS